jgi:hypothetical protein
MQELSRGIISDTSRRRYLAAIDRLVERGAEGVVLGCTEIPLLVRPEHSRVPLFATTALHAEEALAWAGERIVWVARDAEIGDRVAEELQAWLGDPTAVAVLEPRTSLAYERSELVPDETAALPSVCTCHMSFSALSFW